ncbi:MAG: transcriptional regulator [Paenibacillus sp.]|nr:transcriptional regulator [Paenibacillus sp.]
MEQVKRKKASDAIYKEIKRKIIEFEYEPNEHLSEELLAKSLEVSRTPLREAFHRLELENLVTKLPTGRMVVARLTIAEAQELFQVRIALEGLLTRHATLNMNDAVLDRLEQVMKDMEAAADAHRHADVVRYGSDFHRLLYESSQNRTAIGFLDQLRSRLERYRRIGGYKHPHYAANLPVEEHRDILARVEAGDAEGAERAMVAHVSRSLETVKETLQTYFIK